METKAFHSRGPALTETSHIRYRRSASLPFTAWLDQNQLVSRVLIDGIGQKSWALALSRNKFELLEKSVDWAMWLAAGLVFPILIERSISRRFARQLRTSPVYKDAFLKSISIQAPLSPLPKPWSVAGWKTFKTSDVPPHYKSRLNG